MRIAVLLSACLAAFALASPAETAVTPLKPAVSRWRGLSEGEWYAGPKITEADLVGKVVLVDEWGFACPPCRALLPRMQEIWKAFKSKPFVLLGSHRQGRKPDEVASLVAENGLTYPIYEGAGLSSGEPSNGGGIPFLYVVNHRGKVVYSGRSEREATEALVTAIGEVGRAPDLLAGVRLVRYRAMKSQLVFGKPIASSVKKLRSDVKYLEKGKSPVQQDQCREARAILAAIDAARQDAEEEIDELLSTDRAKAEKMIAAFRRTFPEEGEKYADILAGAKSAK